MMGLPLGIDWMVMGVPWVVILVVVVVILARKSPGPGSPETILKRRYAAGEISREQYEQMLIEIRR
jgi:putative membrane protein